jgi:cytochrome d ubiquinol oxidase subunit I
MSVRIENGVKAVIAMEAVRKNPEDKAAQAIFAEHQADMGYGLLVKKYAPDLTQASAADMDKAAMDTVPPVAPLFWSFRVMVFLGISFIVLFAASFWVSSKNTIRQSRRLLKLNLYWLPMPWIAIMCGWFVAENGRQPWTVFGMLPTHLSASSVSASSVLASIIGFILFYTALLIVEMYLMFKYARLGPASLTDHN